MDLISQVIYWNKQRYSQIYDHKLTLNLLDSELTELKEAKSKVGRVDACVDIMYVAIGALWKYGLSEKSIQLRLTSVVKKDSVGFNPGLIEAVFSFESLLPIGSLGYILSKLHKGKIQGPLEELIISALCQLKFNYGLTERQVKLCIKAVCDANNSKIAVKTQAHIKANIDKGPNFVPPEKSIAKILASSNTEPPLLKKQTDLMSPQTRNALLIRLAETSVCKKRKVAAVIVDNEGRIVCTGVNRPPPGYTSCETPHGESLPGVIHAERDAVQKFPPKSPNGPFTMYVTHKPCDTCKALVIKAGISKVVVDTQFLKFDKNKLRYDLIPTESAKAEAEVLTYGAKKYKANNWKRADDTSRYTAALYRHLEAWRAGELIDKESGLSHLAHAKTNIAFLIWFEANN